MRVRRRSALLSAAFLTLATLTVGPTAVTAQQPPEVFQPPGNFPPPGDTLKADQIRTALLRLGGQAGDFPKDLEPFAEAIKKQVLKQAPNADPAIIDSVMRRIINDPARMQQLRDIASKQAASGGKTPAATDIGKMFRNLPSEIPGLPQDFGKQVGKQFQDGLPPPAPVPAPTPGPAPPVAVGGDQTPQQKDDEPRTANPGKAATPVPPKPPMPPPNPSQAANPPPPPMPANPPEANESPRPPDPFERTPQDKTRGKALRTIAGAWERNIGPLNETPGVQRALAELVTGAGDLKDADGNSIWDSFDKQLGDGEGFTNWFDNASFGENFKMPSMNWPSMNWGGGNFDGGSSSSRQSWWNRGSTPRSGSSGSRGGFGVPGLE